MPFHWKCFYRGRILAGTCHSAKMNKTIIVRRNYLHYIKKYQSHFGELTSTILFALLKSFSFMPLT
ncbi:hypothetical protein DVH24_026097 [Malus domestica]|uniref:40S ribosomal protein S11 N-terminal domain-containing protein n=1 Tax=Malus domestica TaxID=3750 RepID=A0A498KIG6_MALDO|nr:hypothetical protein DVH24_026097 [Malus domestica]